MDLANRDQALREILAELCEADTQAPARHIRQGNGSVLIRADVAIEAMRRAYALAESKEELAKRLGGPPLRGLEE